MIWLQKQPTNAVESLEEYLTSFFEKEQADYRLIFQKLTRQGWSAETILKDSLLPVGKDQTQSLTWTNQPTWWEALPFANYGPMP
ncbi:hypothetical protein [Streptococcus suis]|uniref:hypothetical protein n=1 Tax=Streptococcus suis TaxID=1307 RepID=UPI0012900CCE|nr:hypothetical protein [Streptococcus suis]